MSSHVTIVSLAAIEDDPDPWMPGRDAMRWYPLGGDSQAPAFVGLTAGHAGDVECSGCEAMVTPFDAYLDGWADSRATIVMRQVRNLLKTPLRVLRGHGVR